MQLQNIVEYGSLSGRNATESTSKANTIECFQFTNRQIAVCTVWLFENYGSRGDNLADHETRLIHVTFLI